MQLGKLNVRLPQLRIAFYYSLKQKFLELFWSSSTGLTTACLVRSTTVLMFIVIIVARIIKHFEAMI